MMLPEMYRSQVQHIQSSPKFEASSEGGSRAVNFPGYTVMTPVAEEDLPNQEFYQQLNLYQQQLLQLPLDSQLIVPVPPASFHLTLADLIWDSAFLYAKEDAAFELQLRDRIAHIFQKFQRLLPQTSPLRWQVLGLLVMPRAVAACLIPKDENSYERLIQFRRTIYQDPQLTRLGIEQHYHFTAHITLGYFGDLAADLDRDRLSDIFSKVNQQWREKPLEILIHRAELRKFDNMTYYYRESDWAVLDF